MTRIQTTPATVVHSVLSASASAPTSRNEYCPATCARLAMTITSAAMMPQPPSQPIHGPNARPAQVNVVPQSGSARSTDHLGHVGLRRVSAVRSLRTLRSGVDVRHDVLDARVVLESVDRQVLAVAGVLEAAVRHLRDQGDVRVDPDAAEVEAPA